MNINFLDAISHPEETIELSAKKMLSAQLILLSYISEFLPLNVHSLLGSLNDFEGFKKTGRNRSINREKLEFVKDCKELSNSESLMFKVFLGIIMNLL